MPNEPSEAEELSGSESPLNALDSESRAFFEREGLSDPIWYEQGLNRKDLDRLYAYAYHLYQEGSYYGAKEILFLLISLELYNFDYHLAMGLCWQKLNHPADALLSFMVARGQRPCDPRPTYFAALSFEQMDEAELAIEFFDHAIKWAKAYPAMKRLRQDAEVRLAALRRDAEPG